MIPTMQALATDCRVYAPDLPGFGRSPGPREALTIPQLADALAAWIAAAGLDRPLLAGNSMGCQILVDFAARKTECVGRLVLIGPTMDREARGAWPQAARLVADTFREAPSLPFVAAYDYVRFGFRRFRQTFQEAMADRIEEKAARVEAPVLIVRGSRDPFAPQRWVEYLTRRFPAGRLVVVPCAAHAVNYSAPEALARIIRSFMASA